MRSYLVNHKTQFQNELIHRMQKEVEDAKTAAINIAMSSMRSMLQRIVAKYGVEISSYTDDYDMSYRVKVELITPDEEVKDDSNSS